MSQTLGLGGVIPRFVNRSWLRNLTVRAMALSSSSDHGDQTRVSIWNQFSVNNALFVIILVVLGSVIRVQCDEFWHMTKVLRVQLFNGKGSLVEGCIQNIDRTGLDFVALNDLISIPPPNTQLHVFAGFGTLKGGRADWLLEKCTELGANSVTPLLTERSPSISCKWDYLIQGCLSCSELALEALLLAYSGIWLPFFGISTKPWWTSCLPNLDNYYKSIYFYSVIPYRKCNIIKKYMDIKISWASKAKG
ncbi:hypothetical protein JHK82_029220 [Glycine max]|uniref:16S rRNA (uracil(1498)-N(3))-methyltransferase n=1 Tax=Glycine max TaxID=3847 RepID=I1LED0_SOYBN|nr:hypothetical protein JHK85_029868 [Glycine max]KAG5005193.1 hypothetical protein JHK86_029332 [Glycine max]KAG5128385.1 hypothetical protein JHK82_029220 [Glycine max]KAG5152990.1 hypothetical protein JHK84_029462 [Glycine max]KAH1140085.1 hypothetical protein GYH30_029120 [Glycine max]